jgi:hypothetical protein
LLLWLAKWNNTPTVIQPKQGGLMTLRIALIAIAGALASASAMARAACASAPGASDAPSTQAPPGWVRDCDPEASDQVLVEALASASAVRDLGALADGGPIAEVTAGARRYWVTRGESPGECLAFEGADAPCPALGRFLGGDVLEARALPLVPCSGEWCPLLVALTSASGGLAFVARVDPALSCNSGAKLSTIWIFPGRASLVLTCRSSMGTADREELVLYDVGDGSLARRLSVEAGRHEHLSLDEIEDGLCPARPVGWIREVPGADDEALVQSFTPRDPYASRGEGVVQMHRWSTEGGRFEPEGEPIVRIYDARSCH